MSDYEYDIGFSNSERDLDPSQFPLVMFRKRDSLQSKSLGVENITEYFSELLGFELPTPDADDEPGVLLWLEGIEGMIEELQRIMPDDPLAEFIGEFDRIGYIATKTSDEIGLEKYVQ